MERTAVKQEMKEMLCDFTSIIGVSGEEQDVVRAMAARLKPYADEVKVSTLGNLTAVKRGSRPAPPS